MRYFKLAILTFCFGCQITVQSPEYSKYFDESTKEIYLKALDYYKNDNYNSADSLFGIVLLKTKMKLTPAMPIDMNPYYYRGHLAIELGKYERAITDFDHVASDTTTDTDILLARSEAFRMLKQYDTAISICSKLLTLNVDSAAILSQRGICYYSNKEVTLACKDFEEVIKLNPLDYNWLDEYLKNCR